MSVTTPRVTVIVPTFNRPNELRHCLEALAQQDFPHDAFEVIVADDGGAISPADVVAEARRNLHVDLLVVDHGGPAHARNRAAERARGEYLAFTDDDCRPDSRWLSTLVAALDLAPDAIVGGRVTNLLVDNPFSSASQTVTDLVYAHYNEDHANARFFASNNLAITASELQRIGGFDECFVILACEDRELCDRWRAGGGRMVYASNAIISHAHRLDLRSFWRQHFTYGRGAYHFHRIRAARGTGRMRDEMSLHADPRTWLVRPFHDRSLGELLRVVSLMALWQLANTAGFFYEAVVRTGYRR